METPKNSQQSEQKKSQKVFASVTTVSGVDDLNQETEAGGPNKTIGSLIGEVVWLLSQSPSHRHLSLGDLEWLLMPPVVLSQYKIFYDEEKRPIGAALWGYLNNEAEQKLKAVGKIGPQDWGNNATVDPEEGLIKNEGGNLWLVELIAPFHDGANFHREKMVGDLVNTTFKGKQFSTMHINPETNRREKIVLGENT